MNKTIIALSGRKQSGKTELSNICRKNGFVVISFATALKTIVANYLNVSIAELNNNKEKLNKFKISSKYLSEKLFVEKQKIDSIMNNIEFESIRHALQFIGTDLIRVLCPNWHIDRLNESIMAENSKKICIDDLRFKNEFEFIRSIGGECWYILRPFTFDISNHQSEIDLCWKDFGKNLIINNIPINRLIKKWEYYIQIINNARFVYPQWFLAIGVKNKLEFRDWLIKKLNKNSTQEIANELKCSRDKMCWWCDRLMIYIDRQIYKFDKCSFLYPDETGSYYAGILTADGCIKMSGKNNALISITNMDYELLDGLKHYLKSDKPIYKRIHNISKKYIYDFDCNDPFILQNLKYWNIKPKKSMREEIPDIIKYNEKCLKQWIVGLIDGDGCIIIPRNQKSITLRILASKSIIEYLQKVIPIHSDVYKHKPHLELYELKWNNYRAVDLRNWLGPKIFLKRKWKKVDEFLNFKTKRQTNPFKQY